jgi:RNA polymerase sigma-70 factor, ECF subfamily
VSVWKSASLYKPEVGGHETQPMTWLIAIMRNKALDALRLRTRLRESEWPEDDEGDAAASGVTAAGASALELFSGAAQALRLDRCFAGLDGTHRQSLALAYYQGLSHSEIAAQMSAPLGSVKAWIRRGLERLKACLAAEGIAR